MSTVPSWSRDCTCDPGSCGYEDGDCPLCRLLPHELPCPKDDTFGVNAPGGPRNTVSNGRAVTFRDGHYWQPVETPLGWVEAVVD